MKIKGCGKKYNRVNMRVTDEFMDMIQFLRVENPALRSKTITHILEYVLEDYTSQPLKHLGMMDLLDMKNIGKDFNKWRENNS